MFPLNEFCAVSRPVRVIDSMGGYNQTLEMVGTFPCRFSGLSSSDKRYAGLTQNGATASLYLNPSADVQTEDVITVRNIDYIALPPVSPSIPVYTKVMLKNVKR